VLFQGGARRGKVVSSHGPRDWKDMQILTTEAARPLAAAVATAFGVEATVLRCERFENGQLQLTLPDRAEVWGDVALFQVFADDVHRQLFELMLALDLLRGKGARVTAVLPHLPYGRSDRPFLPGGPVAGGLVATLLETAGLVGLVCVEPHSAQTAGFFRVPVAQVAFAPLAAARLRASGLSDAVAVSPDFGGARRAEQLAAALECPLAMIRKHRDGSAHAAVELFGEVRGRTAILIDDEVNTGQTLVTAGRLLRAAGARGVILAVAHAAWTAPALKAFPAAEFDRILLSDSTGSALLPKTAEVIPLAGEIAGALRALRPQAAAGRSAPD
jgi:ribose-phosphate pyrophosphokinase